MSLDAIRQANFQSIENLVKLVHTLVREWGPNGTNLHELHTDFDSDYGNDTDECATI